MRWTTPIAWRWSWKSLVAIRGGLTIFGKVTAHYCPCTSALYEKFTKNIAKALHSSVG
jgi:hypothetical protein